LGIVELRRIVPCTPVYFKGNMIVAMNSSHVPSSTDPSGIVFVVVVIILVIGWMK
jgi:hypothetical protein